MKCSNCSNEMVQSRAGWLCVSCGHIEPAQTAGTDATIATGKDSHDQMRAASETDSPAKAEAAEPETTSEDSAKSQEAAPEAESKPDEPASEDDKAEDEPATEAKEETETEAVPAATDESKSDSDKPEDEPDKTDAEAKIDDVKADEPAVNVEPKPDAELVPAEPAPVETAIKVTPATPDAPAEVSTAKADEVPAEDLTAVEEIVAQVEAATGKATTADDKSDADKPADDEKTEKADEPAASEPKTDTSEPATEEPETDDAPAEEPKPEDEAAKTETEPVETSAEPEPTDIPEPETPEATEPPAEPSPEPAPETTPEPTPSPEPELADKPESDDKSDSPDAPENAPEPTPAAETVPVAVPLTVPDAIASTAPSISPAPSVPPVTPISQTTPVVESTPGIPLNGKPPLTPVTHPAPFKLNLVFKLVAAALVVIILGLVAYLYAYAPQTSLGSYLQKLTSAKTTAFASTLSISSDGYRVAIKLDGKDDLNDIAKPKLDLGITGQISADQTLTGLSTSSGSVAVRAMVVDQVAYLKLENISFLSELVPIEISKDWYKYAINDSEAGKCVSKGKGSGSFLGTSVLTKIPVKKTAFLGVDTIAGSKMLHYRGTVDNSKIKAAIDKANKELSADCKLNISEDDYKDMEVSYEIWRGFGKDRLKVNLKDTTNSKSTAELIIDTSAYNKPVTINAPTGAKDIKELIEDLFGGAFGTEASDANAYDTNRKTAVSMWASQVEVYVSDNNGSYPASATVLAKETVEGELSLDPITKAPYKIVATTPALGEIQYVRSARCNADGTVAIIKPTSSRKYAVATKLEGTGAAYYCVDNQ